ncbi:extracytoplasmic function alternative sigma factor [Paraburkholderia caribensis MBA4]|uniref:Extracytoplasmic function alternative sigma factor n=1 Tax=Paraburkholderia caribensis MBA4 TaxID=1323664 RepID=A0A0P0RIB9_9BURK|nr:DUF1109 domain-containing protein [Paraburkholderia caribensis]ALL68408.1 extracytoplasmic function alternative sigma factor [Paraburkholderia caribensis MBA4]
MKTDDLIGFLSNEVHAVEHDTVARRFAKALSLGAVASLMLMSMVYGVRHDLGSVAQTPVFWAKIAYPLAVAIGATLAVLRLGRPGTPAGYSWAVIALPFVAVWIAGGLALDGAAPVDRWQLTLGHTWRTCPFNVLLLSVPMFPATFWALKGLAPTQLRLAGAIAGLLASSIATLVYCLHCPEMSPAFWSVWYVMGMSISVGIGAWLGPKLLRW